MRKASSPEKKRGPEGEFLDLLEDPFGVDVLVFDEAVIAEPSTKTIHHQYHFG